MSTFRKAFSVTLGIAAAIAVVGLVSVTALFLIATKILGLGG